ncbi:MAG TPA: VPDSG-CTERM sorting domain-containing protein [Terrimicrobiaceae bacterium]
MKIKSTPLGRLLLVSAGSLAFAGLPLAYGVPTLRITDGINTVTIADTTNLSGGDLNPLAGAVTYSGGLGSFFLTVSTGTSKPVQGSSTLPYLTLDSVEISGTAGTLAILFSDDSFGPTYDGATASIYGYTGGSVTYSAYADDSNVLFGTGTLLTTPGPFGPGNISGAAFGALALPANYSLTQKVVVTHGGWGVTNLIAKLQAVPDGGSTVALLGAVLVGLDGLRRKCRGALGTT